MKRMLVTGGAGFIGSNFIHYILDNKQEVALLVNMDALTYAGNLENLKTMEKDPRYHFVKGDIRDRNLVETLFEEYDFDIVVHFAADDKLPFQNHQKEESDSGPDEDKFILI